MFTSLFCVCVCVCVCVYVHAINSAPLGFVALEDFADVNEGEDVDAKTTVFTVTLSGEIWELTPSLAPLAPTAQTWVETLLGAKRKAAAASLAQSISAVGSAGGASVDTTDSEAMDAALSSSAAGRSEGHDKPYHKNMKRLAAGQQQVAAGPSPSKLSDLESDIFTKSRGEASKSSLTPMQTDMKRLSDDTDPTRAPPPTSIVVGSTEDERGCCQKCTGVRLDCTIM
jgi:hypothetical protein